MKKRSKRGWYCKICGQFKANEKFSGKGRGQHICKDCYKKIQEEKLSKKQVLKMEKAQTYEQLIPQISLIKGDGNHVGRGQCFGTTTFIFSSLFWCGFYVVKGYSLELGPF